MKYLIHSAYIFPYKLSFAFILNDNKISKVLLANSPCLFHRDMFFAEIILFIFMYNPSIISGLIFWKIKKHIHYILIWFVKSLKLYRKSSFERGKSPTKLVVWFRF